MLSKLKKALRLVSFFCTILMVWGVISSVRAEGVSSESTATAPSEQQASNSAATISQKESEAKAVNASNIVINLNQEWLKAAALAKERGDDEPVYLVRYIQSLQDRVAAGKFIVRPILSPILSEIGSRFLAINSAVWRKKENMYALLTYLFSGGDPNVVNYIFKSFNANTISKDLEKGAAAYINGDEAGFSKYFARFTEDKTLPWDVRAAINLNLASYLAEKQPEEARQIFDTVRITVPGSFFEEATIRREMLIAAKFNDSKLVKKLMRSYAARFRSSPYSNELWRNYVQAVDDMQYKLSLSQLSDILDSATPKMRYAVYMNVSRHQLLAGNLPYAKSAALRAVSIGDKNHYNVNSGLLYYAASMLASPNTELVNKIIQDIDVTQLAASDQPLFVACESIVNYLANDSLPNSDTQARRNLRMLVNKDEVAIFLNKLHQDNHKAVMTALLSPAEASPKSVERPAVANVSGFIKSLADKVKDVDKMLESADGTAE